MSFFLPSRLIDFEYFDGEPDEEYNKIAKPYLSDIDFAFFVVNFGYSKSEYEQLTPREKVFIRKAWENKMVTDTTNLYRAVYTATYNVNRPKRKKAMKLWIKKSVRKADMNVINEHMSIIRENDRIEGKGWVDLIYQQNGKKRKEVK